jgi:hypothetical protein
VIAPFFYDPIDPIDLIPISIPLLDLILIPILDLIFIDPILVQQIDIVKPT